MLLTKEQILAAEDLPFEDVLTPEWGEGAEVRIQMLSGKERIRLGNEINEKGEAGVDLKEFIPEIISLSVVDENRERQFSETDIEALMDKNYDALMRIFKEAIKLNKLSKEGVEDAVKNS